MGFRNVRNAMIALSALGLVAAAPSTVAWHCQWTTSSPEIAIANQYIDHDFCQPECTYSIWWYEESNGRPGLQRGDEVVDDTCRGQIESDTILGIGRSDLHSIAFR